jgi:hypothetical protein
MNPNIVKIRPDPDRPPDETLLPGGFIVEAMVISRMLKKLKAKEAEVSEIPEKSRGRQTSTGVLCQ